ncbi:hypothetical protein [Endothiovibrio diazotrophicus]
MKWFRKEIAPRGALLALTALLASGVIAPSWADGCGKGFSPQALKPTDPQLCQSLAAAVRDPSALPLNQYEEQLNQFFGHWCHRDPASGWAHDKDVRDTGPYTAVRGSGEWSGNYHGTHSPVMIWYSPEMVEWLKTNRPAGGEPVAAPAPIPDGAIMVKEMYPTPAAACAGTDPYHLFPTSGAAIMVRDRQASHDGWFWGWYGWEGEGWSPDWPADPKKNGLPNMGFGQYCMNCHASAQQMTFSDLRNIAGEPGDPLVYLSQDFFNNQYLGGGTPATPAKRSPANDTMSGLMTSSDIHQQHATVEGGTVPLTSPLAQSLPEMPSSIKRKGDEGGSGRHVPFRLTSQTYDNVWMPASGPAPESMYLTSDQCLGCHDAGSTGLQFDMTTPDPHGDKLLNLSPYATWRTSPMGLAGRDPIFLAQLASETQTFHPESSDLIQTTCLGCHGIQGQRQYQIDHFQKDGECGTFERSMIDAAPYPDGNPAAKDAKYGALSRDGIACSGCHHMVLGPQDTQKYQGATQNACVMQRQALLNPDETGFAKTFTGSFLVGEEDKFYGPFAQPKTRPMVQSLGTAPAQNAIMKDSEVCGTCHTVHLPVIDNGKFIGHFYEQTTYPEWAFSDYRTGKSVYGPLPEGAGPKAQSCQGCHMASGDQHGKFRSKIASIQEFSNFPEAEHRLPKEEIDLQVREGFAKHTLVGLNLFLVEMFKQFPEVLGVSEQDPMLGSKGLSPIQLTARAMEEQAAHATATIQVVGKPTIAKGQLAATVAIASLTGHKFPSGVGFRRAFLTFEVLDAKGDTLWASGRVNPAGELVDEQGQVLPGELWWEKDCAGRIAPEKRLHQPHYQVISRQDQVQIYQELVSTPPLKSQDGKAPQCGHGVAPAGQLTTGFLGICTVVKDNRLPPPGYLGLKERKAIAKALGAGEDLAEDSGFVGIDGDPDYTGPTANGGDTLRYEVPLSAIHGEPASVRATLSYQAIPPFFLQDRMCTAVGNDTNRLAYLASRLNLDDTLAKDWALKVVDTGEVAVVR